MPIIPQTLYVVSLFIWLVVFLLGKLQYNRLRKRTIELALTKAEALLRKNRALTVEECYEAMLTDWEAMLKKSTYFIPHQTELWPMPAKPGYVRQRMNLTPLWLGVFLRLHGFHLPAAPDLQRQIDEVVRNTQRSRNEREPGRKSG